MTINDFDDIRSFTDEEVPFYMKKNIDSLAFKQSFEFIYPNKTEKEYRHFVNNEVNNLQEFKSKCILKATEQVIDTKSNGLSYNDLSFIDENETYFYISNHRDIVLDAAILNTILLKENKTLTQTAIGDNLLLNEVIGDIGKLMGCFIVKRNLPPREAIKASEKLAFYMQFALDNLRTSIWIAQKEGRTKDGNDKTNPAILKMIAMGNKELSLDDFFKKIKIIPVSISYELDPTDYLKIPELLAQENDQEYVKKEGEDALSILRGGLGYKGKIHYEFGKPLDKELDALKEHSSPNKKIRMVAEIIDRYIYKNYKLNEINYVAYDMTHKTDRFKDKYSEKDINFLNNRIDVRAKDSGIDRETVKKFMLKIYGNPVHNKYNN